MPAHIGAVTLTTLAVTALLAVPAAVAAPSPGAHDRAEVRDRAAQVGRIKAELARAAGHLDDLAAAAELAVERYNGARVRLAQAGQEYRATRTHATQAQQRLAETRHELAVFAATAYRSEAGYLSGATILGGSGGPSGFMDRADFVQVLAARQKNAVAREKAARTVSDMFRREAAQALDAQRADTVRADTARQVAAAAVTEQRAITARMRAREGKLVASLGKAKAHAAARRTQGRGLSVPGTDRGAIVARAALKWIGTPYSWGGGSASGPTIGIAQGAHTVGFDCSGLVTYAWAKAGVPLAHYATTQYYSGPHPSRAALRPGDLVFFAHNPADPETIHHVGVYVGHGEMVEAPFTGAKVRVSSAFRPDYAGATRPG